MTFQTLISVEALAPQLNNPDYLVVDCRFNLANPPAGQVAYEQAHIPGAVYAHLDHNLSGPPVTDNGRHPLPTPAALNQLFSQWGITPQTQVVAYDDNNLTAGRLWWLLHYMGHTAAAVLDGGWKAWQNAGLPEKSGTENRQPAVFNGTPRREWVVFIDEVEEQKLLIDSRDPARYRGEIEPIDAQAGHIPTAVNYPFQQNFGPDGRFLPPDQLQANFQHLLQNTSPAEATFYCGSGVTACMNLLALAHAGLGIGKLYAGSWSEWSRTPGRVIAQDL